MLKARFIQHFFRVMSILSAMGLALPAMAVDEPVKASKELIATINGEFKGADATNNSRKSLERFFNYDVLVSEPIRPHLASLSKKQAETYQKVFRDLLALGSQVGTGGLLSGMEISWKPPRVEEKKADVKLVAIDPKQDMETTVVFHWLKHKGDWRIIDVSFDGASLVKDYQNQFGRIIRKEGGDGLIKRITARLDKEKAKRLI
ncbi:MAG: ABC transporter substrate-binding protein [Myxococcota bacterium]